MTQLDEFRALGLSEETLEAIRAKGFEQPSPIQRETIPLILSTECDVIAQAQTGTGKTAAFGLPVLERIKKSTGKPQALVLVPTRELALQVVDELNSLKKNSSITISAIYGGASIEEQLRRLKKGVDIVVGTPGRTLDHIRRKTIDLKSLDWAVLDEADEMLNMGFIDDVNEILSEAGGNERILLFSATMPPRVADLSQRFMKEIKHIKIESKQLTADLTDQIYFEVRESDKFDALTRIIDVENEFYAIVFSRTKVAADELTTKLLERGYAVDALHGDVSQAQREKILRRFKRKQINILVATDVAARGIDVNNLTHVINYSLPQDSESYVHRIGRTGRAGREGTAITFISKSEYRLFTSMCRHVKMDIRREELPTVSDVITIKKQNIVEELQETIDAQLFGDYEQMADEILGNVDARTALSALLKMAFKNDLDKSSYPEIRSFSVDRKGTARIFIAIGRRDGLTAKALVDLIREVSSVPDRKIDDVKILEEYSFVTIPFEDAEAVTRALNKREGGSRPIAEIAKEKREGGRGRGRGDRGGEGRGESRGEGRGRGGEGRSFRGERGGEGRGRSGEGRSFRGEGRGDRRGPSRDGAKGGSRGGSRDGGRRRR